MNQATPEVVVLISADTEWQVLQEFLPADRMQASPCGQWFSRSIPVGSRAVPVIFFHGGWGKIAAAGSTQYVIDCWHPRRLLNLGTCGGFAGHVVVGEILLVEKTVVYDILEQIADSDAALAHYTTTLDLSWLREPYPFPVRRTLMVSGDRDLVPEEVQELHQRFGAVAGDWESAAIAWVAHRNRVPCLILRGVSDVVGPGGGEVYGNLEGYRERTRLIMKHLIDHLPEWLALM